MIPKIIHYCWFGGKPLPESAKVCIESWKRNFPGFEIMEWNEKNFDINSHQFVKECCEVKKYGFVVDVLRNHVLKEYGGIYLDTDVQFIKPIPEDMLDAKSIICYEDYNLPNVGFIASEKNGQMVNDVCNLYKDRHFVNEDGTINDGFTGPIGYKKVIAEKGIVLDGTRKENYDGGLIYPQEYFCAKSWATKEINLTYNTYAIHHYDASWVSEEAKREARINMMRIKMYRSAKELRKLKVEEILIFRASGFDYRIFCNYFLYTLKNKFGKFFGKK